MITLKQPLEAIIKYTNFIKHFNKIETEVISTSKCSNRIEYKAVDTIFQKKFRNSIFLNDAVHGTYVKYYTSNLFLDPVIFNKNKSKVKNWYEFVESTSIPIPVFDVDTKHLLPNSMTESERFSITKYIHIRNKNQYKFKEKIIKLNVEFNEEMINDYIKFLQLIKKYPGKTLVPTLLIDIVWHAHMLDHNCYVKDTTDFFGCILNHDDNDHNGKSNKNLIKTSDLWKENYKEDYLKKPSSSSSSCGCSYFTQPVHDHVINIVHPINSCSYDGIISCSTGSSCGGSSCGSSCGGGD